MKHIPITEAKEGMVIACNILSPSGQILVPKGAALTGLIIRALLKRGVDIVEVEGSQEEEPNYTEQQIQQAEALCAEMVENRFPKELSSRVMKKLFQAVLHFEALRRLSHGRKDTEHH